MKGGAFELNLAVSMWSLHREAREGRLDTAGFLAWAASEGFGAVELLDVFWADPQREIADARRRMDDLGLRLAAYDATNDFAWPDAVQRAEQVSRVKRAIDTAVQLGGRVVRIFAGDVKQGVDWHQARGWVLESLRACVEYAGQAGVVLALENHGHLAGKAEQLLDLVHSVSSSYLRLSLDPANFALADERAVEAVRRLAHLAVHVHVKDVQEAADAGHGDAPVARSLEGRLFKLVAAGDGEVGWQEIIGELQKAGYSGCLSIEYEGPGDERTGVKRSRENLARFLQGSGPSV